LHGSLRGEDIDFPHYGIRCHGSRCHLRSASLVGGLQGFARVSISIAPGRDRLPSGDGSRCGLP
jgi:hypothetical protein